MNPPFSPLIIAIDGPSAAGKGTLARRLASHLGYAHLDSGMLYRAVAAQLLAAGKDGSDPAAAIDAAETLRPEKLQHPDLRLEKVAQEASRVAAIPGVRAALLDWQRNFAAHPPGGASGAIIDGRDIGTVVCPQAPVKLFITASTEARARRRHQELLGRGYQSDLAQVLAEMQERDRRDSVRAASPLVPAGDAVIVDTSAMDPDAVFTQALSIIDRLGTDTAQVKGK